MQLAAVIVFSGFNKMIQVSQQTGCINKLLPPPLYQVRVKNHSSFFTHRGLLGSDLLHNRLLRVFGNHGGLRSRSAESLWFGFQQ